MTRDGILKTLLCLVVLGIVVLIFCMEWQRKVQRDEYLVARNQICASVCVARESDFHSVYRQRIGFGSFEWRCGCMDGHVQVIP